MRFIKLDAVSSTNDFLKDLVKNRLAQPFTVVSTEHQTNGRGQRSASWVAQSGKNLMFSVLVTKNSISQTYLFALNAAIATSLVEVLSTYKIPNLTIKWPNDIMSGDKKIAGILIENTLSANSVSSIVGIGLNVNQTDFAMLPNASSMALVAATEFDREQLLRDIVTQIKNNADLTENNSEKFWNFYNENLFKRNVLSRFQLEDKSVITAKISLVNGNGLLVIDHENQEKVYDIKQIQLIY